MTDARKSNLESDIHTRARRPVRHRVRRYAGAGGGARGGGRARARRRPQPPRPLHPRRAARNEDTPRGDAPHPRRRLRGRRRLGRRRRNGAERGAARRRQSPLRRQPAPSARREPERLQRGVRRDARRKRRPHPGRPLLRAGRRDVRPRARRRRPARRLRPRRPTGRARPRPQPARRDRQSRDHRLLLRRARRLYGRLQPGVGRGGGLLGRQFPRPTASTRTNRRP